MKNFFIGLLLGIIFGVAGGFAGGIFVFPYLFPPPEVNETAGDRSSEQVVARGTFIHADPSDKVHWGRGGVSVFSDLVHLEANFEVGPGPKYHVYLVPDADITPSFPVDETMFVDLGRLKAFSGGQNYAVPAGVNLSEFKSVVIWCEQFGVLISPATLSF